jgi:hypothetical protein
MALAPRALPLTLGALPLLLSGLIHAQVQEGHAPPITFSSLVDEMTDSGAAARWPEPPFTLKQASSYDRRSQTPGTPDWFANRDWSNFVRTETVRTAQGDRTEYVMLDESGPGAIVRFWAGGFTSVGTLRIYIDGASKPSLIGTADEIIGGQKYFPKPYAATRARGKDLYAPIPYAKHVKVTYDGPLPRKPDDPGTVGFWYNIDYRTYPATTRLVSFSIDVLSQMRRKLRAATPSLVLRMKLPYVWTGTVSPGDAFQVPVVKRGTWAITGLQLRIRAPNIEAALRQTVLTISFDGQKTVEVPVGDFFGSGVGINVLEDRWRHIDWDGSMSARWPMPYRKICEMQLRNYGTQPVHYELAIAQSAWSWDDRSLYFHADWRRQALSTVEFSDFNYLSVQSGRGVYMGDTLAVFNPVALWWGEGDEKVWVDGESFPSIFGTGTEDYYGYAWGDSEVFSAPFHAQPRAGSQNQGHTTNTRVRGLDGIPFQKSLKFDMEVWPWHRLGLNYAVTTYWYGDAAARSKSQFDSSQLSVPPGGS